MNSPTDSHGIPPARNTFLNVDAEILQKALELIRDKFRLATDATIFLELKTRTSGINIGIANLRDATSHLATLLKMHGDGREAQFAQLQNIEEHVRRAVMEPYEKTVHILEAKFLILLERYRELVLTLPNREEVLPSAPTLQQVNSALQAVDQMCAQGRLAKLENSWSDAWEDGVKHFIRAVNELEALSRELDDYLLKAQQIRRQQELQTLSKNLMAETTRQGDESKQFSLRMMIVGAILSAILGAILGIAGSNLFSPRISPPPAAGVVQPSR